MPKSKCKYCSNYFVRDEENPIEALWVKFCSKKCRVSFIAQKNTEKKEKTKVKKEKVKTKRAFSRSKLTQEADRVWSIYIRERDRWEPCITCGKPCEDTHQAGHFMSRRHLNTRWEKQNGAGQCPKCNCWGAWEQYLYAIELEKRSPWLPERLRKLAMSIEKVTDDEILEYIRLYYRLLAEMWVDCKPKKMYLYN